MALDPEARNPMAPSAQASALRPTVLVVDDTVEVIDLLLDLLKERDRIKAATGGRKALEIATSHSPPDLRLLGSKMPDLSG